MPIIRRLGGPCLVGILDPETGRQIAVSFDHSEQKLLPREIAEVLLKREPGSWEVLDNGEALRVRHVYRVRERGDLGDASSKD